MTVAGYTIYGSPNAYLGVALATRRLAALGVRIERRPIFVPRSRGVKVADLVGGIETERRSAYHREDCERWARRHGIELVLPPRGAFEQRARRWATSPFEREELPARAYYAAAGSGREAALDAALFRAAWVEGLDVNEEDVVRRAAAGAGLDPDDVLRGARDPETRRRAEAALAAFDRDGCPGVPTWVVAGERFWGKDRVDLLVDRVTELSRPGAGAAGGVRVRTYRTPDREAVTALWQEAFPGDPPRNAPEAILERKLAQQPDLLLVAEADAAVAGVVLVGWDGHRGWIHHLAVDAARRRRGIGRALLAEGERRLRALGCPKVNLQVLPSNAGVVPFYERLGYAVEDRLSLGKLL